MSANTDRHIMKYKYFIDDILGQKTKVKILRYLVVHQEEQSGRHIALEAGVNHWQCHKVLQEFYKRGILTMKRAGNTYLFGFRKNQYIVKKAIIPLFGTELGLTDNLIRDLIGVIKKLVNKNEILSLVLFGSMTTGKGKPHSDLDFMVLVKDKADTQAINEEITENNDYFMDSYGNMLSPYIIARSEFLKRHKKRDKLIENIIKQGNIIYGKTIGEIITE